MRGSGALVARPGRFPTLPAQKRNRKEKRLGERGEH